MGTNIDAIITADKENWGATVETFIEKSSDVFMFPELNIGSKRKDVWNALFNITKYSNDPIIIKNCFIAVRILSRQKDNLIEVITDDWINLMKLHSGLDTIEKFEYNQTNIDISIEVLKSFSNILFNSRQLAAKSINNGVLDGLTTRITNSDKNISDEIRYMDMRLLFIITALCPEARKKVNNMIEPLINLLEDTLKKSAENHTENDNLPPIFLTDVQVDLVSEILKALFNITININYEDPEILPICLNLVKILRSYLLISSVNLDKTWTLRNNVINLLTNMPEEAFDQLLIPISNKQNIVKSLQYEQYNMTAIYEILMCLKTKFNDEPTVSAQHEIFSPVVTVLLKGANGYRVIRKFLRNQILPPLKEVHSRPEDGKSIRNHLCRMLTTPITQLRDLVAEFLFVLCKKSVTRMIKYTGYGNAAGLFAQRGLLAGGHDSGERDYSSDSENSETEEYADHKHGINPVIGCYQENKPSITANMSEEQKEYEAMKLVELMDSLLKCGTIKPCIVNEYGKAVPIKHVLQLQEGLQTQQLQTNDDNDDDKD